MCSELGGRCRWSGEVIGGRGYACMASSLVASISVMTVCCPDVPSIEKSVSREQAGLCASFVADLMSHEMGLGYSSSYMIFIIFALVAEIFMRIAISTLHLASKPPKPF